MSSVFGKINAKNGIDTDGILNIFNSTASTSSTTGSFVCAGGVGISGDLYVGGTVNHEKVEVIPTTTATITLSKYITSIQDAGTYSLANFTGTFPEVGRKRIILPDSWSALSSGTDSSIIAVATSGTSVYVGGAFSTAGGVSASSIAVWDTVARTWSALGSGTNGNVFAITIIGSDVYVGGSFTLAGGITANSIAKWDTLTSTWSALIDGGNNGVSGGSGAILVMAAESTNLYVGGNFTSAGGVANTVRIAKWSGSAWSALGTGISTNSVSAIAVENATSVYVGGDFTGAGGVANTVRIAKWNGTVWSALGTGISTGIVNVIAMDGSAAFVGGTFTGAGGVANTIRIARWTGAAWTALVATLPTASNGISNGTVNDIVVLNSTNVYVGGTFTSSGTPIFNFIMKWNGSNTWSGLGSGIYSNVNALALNGTDLYVGGAFTSSTDAINLNRIAKFSEPISVFLTFNSDVDSLTLGSGGEVEFVSVPTFGQNEYRWKMVQSIDIETNKTRFISINVRPGLMPPNGVAGDVYYDSGTNKLRCHNGTVWNDLF